MFCLQSATVRVTGGDTTCSRSTTKSSRTRSGHRYERRHGRTDGIGFVFLNSHGRAVSSSVASAYQCRSVGVHPARHAITLLSCKRRWNLLVCGCSLAHSRGLVCRRGAWKLPCLSVHINPSRPAGHRLAFFCLALLELAALTSVDLSGFTLPDMRSLCSLVSEQGIYWFADVLWLTPAG